MSRAKLGLWITTVVWVAVGVGMWGYYEHQLRTGAELALKCVPVDPRSLLRGEYLVLRYDLSGYELEPDEVGTFRHNQKIYAVVEESAGEWRLREVLSAPPEQGLFLRGRVVTVTQSSLQVEYGIESFFLPEGEGSRYEEALAAERLWAVARVSPRGAARLERLEIR